MSLFKTQIQNILAQIERSYARKDWDRKSVHTAMFYFQQLEPFLTQEQKDKWTEALADSFLTIKEGTQNDRQLEAKMNAYLSVIISKVKKVIPYFSSYQKIVVYLDSILELRHHLNISNNAYEVYKDNFKPVLNPSEKEIKDMVTLEVAWGNRLAQTRELGHYIDFSRECATLLGRARGVYVRTRQNRMQIDTIDGTFTLFTIDFYNGLFKLPSGQLDVIRSVREELISAVNLLEGAQKHLENKNGQGQLIDSINAIRRISVILKNQVDVLKSANHDIGFDPILSSSNANDKRTITMDQIEEVQKAA